MADLERAKTALRCCACWLALAGGALFGVQGVAVAAERPSGPTTGRSLYPESATGVVQSDLARALGAAAYALTDIGQSEAFRRSVQNAVARHPSVLLQVSEVDEARAALRAERAALMPRLSASVNGDYVISREFGVDTDNPVEALRPGAQSTAGLSVSQLVFDGGAAFARIGGAKARTRANNLTASERAVDVALSVLAVYHDVAAYQAIVALGDDFIHRHEQLLDDVRERERLGTGSRADVMQASAQLATARARIVQIRESASLAEIRYKEFFREDPGSLRRPSFASLGVGSRDEAIAAALQRHPSLAAASARVDGAVADYRAAKAARLPEVRASVDAVKFGFVDSDDYDVRARLAMNYDLFAGGVRGAAIAQARETARQNRYDEERVGLELARDAAIAFERQKAAEARLGALEEAVISHYKARDLVGERYRVARGDLINLLQAENQWFEAGVAYLIGAASRDLAVYEMMGFTGDLLRFFSPEGVDLPGAPDAAASGEAVRDAETAARAGGERSALVDG